MGQLCNKQCSLPMNVVLSVCREVIVNDQGNLLDVNPTRLRGEKLHLYNCKTHLGQIQMIQKQSSKMFLSLVDK